MMKYLYIFLVIWCIPMFLSSQENIDTGTVNFQTFNIPDSLSNSTLKELKSKYHAGKNDSKKANLYRTSYLKKSIQTGDSLQIAKAYMFLSNTVQNDAIRVQYLDSSIVYAKNQVHLAYPAYSYFKKGSLFYKKARYREALNYYFKALDHAQKNNPRLANDIKFNIGLLKNHIGKSEEALKIFKACHPTFENSKEIKAQPYLVSLFALSDAYSKLQKNDSATSINVYGIQKAKEYGLDYMKQYFIMNEGVNSFFKKQYTQSIDSIIKVMPFLTQNEDHANILFSRFYLGRSYLEANQTQKGLTQLKKVDSLLKKRPDFIPEIKETYKLLIEHYTKANDTEQQLYYHKRLAVYDSMMYLNYQNISDRIVTDFDTPLILQEKDELISDLTKSNRNTLQWGIPIFIFFLVLCAILIYRNVILKRKYDKKFQNLIEQNQEEIPSLKVKEEIATPPSVLSEEIITKIEKGLNNFVTNKRYLNQNVTISSLAKKMGSNSKYLSQYLNHYEKKKFTDYINDLRISYTVEKLKEDTKFRKYTVKAISETVGFSNPVSFSQAFFKKTGIKPSYFIKKLESM